MRKTVLLLASMASGVLLASGVALVFMEGAGDSAQAQQKSNIVLVMTDDQSTNTLRYMPNLRQHLQKQGTDFRNYFITYPTCCPARASYLRGQYAHNHNIGFGMNLFEDFAAQGHQRSTVATWLDSQGYRTGLFGKYLDGYRQTRSVPPGWDRWVANADRDVWARCFNYNGHKKCIGDKKHPDVFLANEAAAFLKSTPNSTPFFMWVSFGAPHEYKDGPPLYARTDRNKFSTVGLPRPPSFNEKEIGDKPSFIAAQKPLSDTEIRAMRKNYLGRLRSLQTVDRSLSQMIQILKARRELDNTYFMFTTDNGFHLGEHRLRAGKLTPYIEDVKFPLIVRGPGVAKGVRSDVLVENVDFAPTAADLAGTTAPSFVDGRSIEPLLHGENVPWRKFAYAEGMHRYPFRALYDPTLAYHHWWKNGDQEEQYDMIRDPYQLQNSLRNGGINPALRTVAEQMSRCEQSECRTLEGKPLP